MKFNYNVKWSNLAKKELLSKAQYIKNSSKSNDVAEKFYNEILNLTEKLSVIGGAYDDGKFHIKPLKNGHSVRFLIIGNSVIIEKFLPKGKNY